MAREFFPYLAIGRFVAAFGVLLFHMGPQFSQTNPPQWLSAIVENGFLGVSFFFVLSGFLLGKVYQPGTFQVKEFILARWLRIFPTYLLFASPYVLEQFITIQKDPSAKSLFELVLPILLVQVWFPGFSQALMGPAWTLACEMFFYALFPWMKARANQNLILWLGIWLVVSQLVPITENFAMNSISESQVADLSYFLSTFPLAYISSFALGVCAAGLTFPSRFAQIAVTVGIVWIIVVCLLPVGRLYKLSSGVAPPMLLIVMGLSKLPGSNSASKLKEFGVLLGDASFVLYLIHRFALRIFAELFKVPSLWLMLFEIVLIIGLSILLHLMVEKRLIQKFKPLTFLRQKN